MDKFNTIALLTVYSFSRTCLFGGVMERYVLPLFNNLPCLLCYCCKREFSISRVESCVRYFLSDALDWSRGGVLGSVMGHWVVTLGFLSLPEAPV